MNFLCSDITGTITEGLIQFDFALDINGEKSAEVFLYRYINAFYQSGYVNP
jgi:Mg2+-importing ATPase